jgi:hypothetical protein
LASRGKKRLLVAARAGVIGSFQLGIAFEANDGALAIAFEVEGSATLRTGGLVELHATVATIDEEGEGRAHEGATWGAGVGFEVLKGGIRVLVIPGVEFVKELGGSIKKRGAALGAGHGAWHIGLLARYKYTCVPSSIQKLALFCNPLSPLRRFCAIPMCQ